MVLYITDAAHRTYTTPLVLLAPSLVEAFASAMFGSFGVALVVLWWCFGGALVVLWWYFGGDALVEMLWR